MPAKWILQWLQGQIDQGLLLGLKRRRPNPKNTMSTNLWDAPDSVHRSMLKQTLHIQIKGSMRPS